MSRTELRVSLSDSKLDGDSSENKRRKGMCDEGCCSGHDKTPAGQKNSFWVHSTLKLLDSPKREKNKEKRWF